MRDTPILWVAVIAAAAFSGRLHAERELFDADGFITEWIRYTSDGQARTRWHFDRGMPVREITRNTEYFKRGDKFGFLQDGQFIETPRGSISR